MQNNCGKSVIDFCFPCPHTALECKYIGLVPLIVSASAMSWLSPVLPTDGSMPASANRSP
jgi:hypothetical protein